MYDSFRTELEIYALDALKEIKEILDTKSITFDHICFQTTSKKDYKHVLDDLKNYITIETEVPHAGRMITVALLKKPLVVNGIKIKRVEISQPKPMRVVQKRNFDHISFLVKDSFNDTVHELRNKGITLSEVKQIGDHHFVKIVRDSIEIELRDKSLGKPYLEKGYKKKKEVLSHEIHEESKRTGVENQKYEKRIKELELMLENEHKKALRALADYQNLSKRIEEQNKRSQSFMNTTLLGQLLDILDDFDRVIDNLTIDEKDQVGIRLLREKIQKVIDSHGLEEIKCFEGDELNPHIHEAVGVVGVSDGKDHEKIKQIIQKGYKLKDSGEIVRPVRVIVGKHTA